MNLKKQSFKKENFSHFFIFTGLVIGIFSPNFADPFNVPKQIVLYIFASYLFFDLFKFKKIIFKSIDKKLLVVVTFYVFGLLMSCVLTNPKYIAIFGDNLRKNGLLTFLSFLIIFFYVTIKFRIDNVREIYRYLLVINLFVSGYGLLQVFNLDFINWTKSGGIVGTLGNSNFAGVAYAFFCLISLGVMFDNQYKFQFIYPVFNFLISLICLINTHARQSILILIFGIVILLINIAHKVKIRIKLAFLAFFGVISIPIILGIFDRGPLASFLYKGSIGVRIYYWKAAVKMFLSHPFFGVGMDRYGSYFKEFRESTYPLKYGFDLTSTNAHNVYLQLFATTGFISGCAYVFLMAYVFYASSKMIKNTSGKTRIYSVNIFSVWIAFQLQSFVSIDNIGIAIFNWIFSGLIVGSYFKLFGQNIEKIDSKTRSPGPVEVLVKPLLIAPAMVIAIFLYQSEHNYLILRNSFNPSNFQTKSLYVDFAIKTLNKPLLDPQYQIAIANSFLDYGDFDLGKKYLNKSYNLDQRDLSTLWGLALSYEIQGDFMQAVQYRTKIEKLDPWNAKNYLQFLNDYIKMNDRSNAEIILKKLNNFAANTNEGKQANLLFTQFYK